MPELDWSTEPLIISELKDATNLNEPQSGRCPDCHRGNNVFLISPDDPTWEKVLRGSLVTDPGSTFTTRVETSDDTSPGHPRYIPSTFPANRPDWVNAFQSGGCADACHENPPLGTFGDLTMPPACAANNVGDCYQ